MVRLTTFDKVLLGLIGAAVVFAGFSPWFFSPEQHSEFFSESGPVEETSLTGVRVCGGIEEMVEALAVVTFVASVWISRNGRSYLRPADDFESHAISA